MSELLTLGRVRLVAGAAQSAAGSTQPKRIALLAYLTLAGRTPVRRDALLALFWPELGEEEGRRALRQALHYLRRVIGDDVFATSGDELGLREGGLDCDALTFEQLLDAGKPAEALELYRGDFFTGFHIDDVSSDYEEWVERTRARLRRRAAAAAWSASEIAAESGNTDRAIDLGRRACELEPDQEAGWRRLMTLHHQVGDRPGALRTYEELAGRLEREFDAKPARETTALAERIRASTGPAVALPSQPPRGERAVASPVAPAVAAEPPTPAPATPEPARRPRAARWLIAAAVVLASVGAYAFAMRERDDASGPSLIAMGALAAKDRVVVADFANLAGDTLLAAAVTEAFRVDISQSPLVTVLTRRQVNAALTRMQRPIGTTIDDSLARDIAVREGAKAVVTGSIGKIANAYTVSVQLVSAARGEPMAAFRETAVDSTALVDAVDRASKQLRHRIGETLRELDAMPALEEATTPSIPALRKYTEGHRLFETGRRTEAIQRYQEATTFDTAFATAYVSLGMAYGSIAEPGRGQAALSRAVAHRDRLPFLEANFAVASHAFARLDYETAIDAYTRVLERYPENIRALNNLALIYNDRRQFVKAESLMAKAASIDSTIANFYFGMHAAQVLAGNFARSRATLDLIARRFPSDPILLNVEMQDAAAQQHWEDAERRAETAIAALAGDTLALIDPFEALAGIMMTQGRLAEADRYWRTQLALSAATRSYGRHVFALTQRAYLELRYRNAPGHAAAMLDSALARLPLDSVLPGDRPYDELARFYARAGRLTRAREMVARAEANDRVLGRPAGPLRTWTLGVMALAEGKAAEAEASLRQAAEGIECTICALPDLARAYEAVGKPDAAVVVYERYLATPWLWRYEPDAVELGWAMKRLAELYDARGETGKASAARTRLLQLWRRADPELQPVLADIRARVKG
jgi:DNA-binding SARP family transcriptional activator/Tfp pilus assembly protein PilF/TolB-like protein